jgi:SAM-dependent methyltransferase
MHERIDPNRPSLPVEVQALLRCPACRGRLRDEEQGEICLNCGRVFPLVKGVARFVETQAYAGTFGFQWHKYARTQLDGEASHESEILFRRKTGFTPEEIAGKLVLDVGCGMGRFAAVASRWGARVIGVDLSSAAEVAAANLSDRDSVTILQADAFSLPFAPGSFDFIYSIGVLHHTPDCERAFKGLTDFLKPGGSIAIWLYSGYNHWYRFSDLYRKLTHRLPARWLHALCYLALPLYHLYRGLRSIPLVGSSASRLLHHLLPISLHPDRDIRVLDTFDWYSPKYQSKHTYEQVFRWFESCGLESLRVLEVPVAVRGRKGLHSSEGDARNEQLVGSKVL